MRGPLHHAALRWGTRIVGGAVGMTSLGNPVADRGKYLAVWRKQADGSWKAVGEYLEPGSAGGNQACGCED